MPEEKPEKKYDTRPKSKKRARTWNTKPPNKEKVKMEKAKYVKENKA